jgi:hypothetical protein
MSIRCPETMTSRFALYELRPTTPLRLRDSGIWSETVVSLPAYCAILDQLVVIKRREVVAPNPAAAEADPSVRNLAVLELSRLPSPKPVRTDPDGAPSGIGHWRFGHQTENLPWIDHFLGHRTQMSPVDAKVEDIDKLLGELEAREPLTLSIDDVIIEVRVRSADFRAI